MYTNNSDIPQIFYAQADPNMDQPAVTGPQIDILPMLPDMNVPAVPGPPINVMPTLPDMNVPAVPGPPINVMPMLPDMNVPAVPGPPDYIMPTLPNPPNQNIFPGVQINPIVLPIAYMRFLHAAPSSPAVDVYVNRRVVAKNLKYSEFTDYMVMLPGVYNITVYATGKLYSPIIVSRVSVSGRTIYTTAITGDPQDLDIELITDKPRTPAPNTSYVRFIHLSPNAPAVDVYVDNNMVISDLAYKEVSNYMTLRPGRHSITLKVAGTDHVVLEDPIANFRNGNFYSAYVVGYIGAYPNLQVLIPLEGNSYLRL